jgi:hypothetical protein
MCRPRQCPAVIALLPSSSRVRPRPRTTIFFTACLRPDQSRLCNVAAGPAWQLTVLPRESPLVGARGGHVGLTSCPAFCTVANGPPALGHKADAAW